MKKYDKPVAAYTEFQLTTVITIGDGTIEEHPHIPVGASNVPDGGNDWVE